MQKYEVGKQKSGRSSNPIYRMAIQAIDVSQMNPGLSVLDVGGGKGELTKRIWRKKDENILIDANPPGALEGAKTKKCDLNDEWPIENSEIDVLFALEVIEHVENPRLFMREVKRVLKNGGVAFMSTPNNESLFSRLNFFLKGEHRYFQESNYPAHINHILTLEMYHICREVNLLVEDVCYSGVDVIPKIGKKVKIGGKWFSKNVGFVVRPY